MKNFVKNYSNLIPVNDTKYKKIFAIGDIHGAFDKFISVWEQIKISDDDLVIFLGDYIDRGNKIAETLQFIMERKDEENIIFLRGNHEQMMLNSMNSDEENEIWQANGGDKTLDALEVLQRKNKNFVADIINFFENLPLYFQIKIGGKNYFFCHAGVDEKIPLDKQTEKTLLWILEEFFDNYNGEDIIISGHSPAMLFFPESKIKPFRVPNRNILMMDTGAFLGKGKLSAVDILTGEFFQNAK